MELVLTSKHATVLFLTVVVLICLPEVQGLPPWLPWFTYTHSVSNLDRYLKEKVPFGHRNVFLLARRVSITSNIELNSGYYAQELPFELTVVCDTLEVTNPHTINLSGDNAPGYVSAAAKNPPSLFVGAINSPRSSWGSNRAWDGKQGADGGSIFIYAKGTAGLGKLNIDISGGQGGRGQDGRQGNSGTPQTWLFPVRHGERGGNGGRGGRGGDAGEIVVNSMINPSNIVGKTTTNGGQGGMGGTGGRGGRGARASWRFLTSARPGRNGRRGRNGVPGRMTTAEKNYFSSSRDFYLSLPVTGNYLQRALNGEMYKIMHARTQSRKFNNRWPEIKRAISWIQDIASANGFDIIHERCTYMLRLCDEFHDDTPVNSNIRIKQSAINEHLDNLKKVVKLAVVIEPSNINEEIHSSQLLKDHSNYARAFNHLARQYNKAQNRYNSVKEDADHFGIDFDVKSSITDFLSESTSSLSSKLSKEITSIAYRAFLRARVRSAIKSEVILTSAEILSALAAGVEAAPVLGIAAEEQEVALERAAVETAGEETLIELNKRWRDYFIDINDALSNLERIIQSRALYQKRSGKYRDARVKKDEKLNKISRPRTRQKYGKQERFRIDDDDESPPMPRLFKYAGKFIGVLDKLETIEANGDQVVVSFDAIHVEFTVSNAGQSTISLNNLDSLQEEELYASLDVYRKPFSVLPSFFITTAVNSETITEDKLGKWFEFDISAIGTSSAVIVSPTLGLLGYPRVLSFMSSLSEVDDIPITVISDSISQLNSNLEAKIVKILGLSTITQQLNLITNGQVPAGRPYLFNERYCGAQQRGSRAVKVSIANVGQGSCNLLHSDRYISPHWNLRYPKIVYDLGYGKGRLTGEAENDLIDAIERSASIIISHWDLDHYRYLLRSPQSILESSIPVTAPEFGSNTGVSVRRVVRSISDRHRHLVAPNTGFIVSRLFNTDVRTTTRATGRSKNDVGAIIVSVLDSECNPLLLMPADASYNYITNEQKLTSANSPSLKYLVATHHGSTRNIGTIPEPEPADDSDDDDFHPVVMYSYGRNNRYRHDIDTAQPLYDRRGWDGDAQVTVGTTNGLRVDLDLDRSHLTPPIRD